MGREDREALTDSKGCSWHDYARRRRSLDSLFASISSEQLSGSGEVLFRLLALPVSISCAAAPVDPSSFLLLLRGGEKSRWSKLFLLRPYVVPDAVLLLLQKYEKFGPSRLLLLLPPPLRGHQLFTG